MTEKRPCPRCNDTGVVETRRPGGGWYVEDCPLLSQEWHK